ncbi:MAG: Gfo/Idh/MocA family protein [Rubrobacteraceae bacterium]
MCRPGAAPGNLVATATGLEAAEVCADLTSFVPGRRLDDDANMLVRYANGARGVLVVPQIFAGEENALTLKVYGGRAASSGARRSRTNFCTSRPRLRRKYISAATSICARRRMGRRGYPPGHPEAFIEAFANIYGAFAEAVRSGGSSDEPPGFPTVHDGGRGVHFIERVVEGAGSGRKWTDARWHAAGGGGGELDPKYRPPEPAGGLARAFAGYLCLMLRDVTAIIIMI